MKPTRVLQTKLVGYAPDPERLHDPRPQIVYEVVGWAEFRKTRRRKPSLFSDESSPYPWRSLIGVALVVTFIFRVLPALLN